MNRRYIDFVPAKKAPVRSSSPIEKTAPKAETTVEEIAVFHEDEPIYHKKQITTAFLEERQVPRPAFIQREPELGIVEDVALENDVEKRPLSSPKKASDDEIKAVKAKKVGNQEVVEKPVEKPEKKESETDKTYKTPKSPFINQEKVEKRPLSKNVYRKKVVTPVKEEPKAPVTIIEKPEKQAHVSLVIAIILTIILGAAAGTVAFLLLPK